MSNPTFTATHADSIVDRADWSNGMQTVYRFPNGYGASVITWRTWIEIGVVKFTSDSPTEWEFFPVEGLTDATGVFSSGVDSLAADLDKIKAL